MFGKANEELLNSSFNEALKDESFKKLTLSLKVNPNILKKYTTKLEETTKELKNCSNCKAVNSCKNKLNGFVYYPEVDGDKLKFEYIACKYKRKQLKEEENSCNYYQMPTSLKKASMKDLDLNDAKRIEIVKYLKTFYDNYEANPYQKGLYLNGSFGSGKTYMICAMLNELSKKGVNITVCYYPELLRSLKESFETDFSDRINKLKKAPILFLDDIGAEAVTEWARDEILGTILQYRMDSNLPTFFTSNLTIEELETHLSNTKKSVDVVKARRIIERIKQLTVSMELISKNRRN